MLLDGRFFELIAATPVPQSHGKVVLESYKAVYARSTMVLFSRKTHTPLAALTMRGNENDIGCLSMLTARPCPPNNSTPHFQGMLSQPDQTFSFTISNLTREGTINFNILHTPNYRVSRVDPGPSYGINEVNELYPDQSYTIEADQRTNCRMVLGGKTKLVPCVGYTAVTVRESEDNNSHKGLYCYLSVVADRSSPSLVQKFQEGTVWKVVPGFVRRRTWLPEFGTPLENTLRSVYGHRLNSLPLLSGATSTVPAFPRGFVGASSTSPGAPTPIHFPMVPPPGSCPRPSH